VKYVYGSLYSKMYLYMFVLLSKNGAYYSSDFRLNGNLAATW